jgi:hypothetical protein
VLVIVMGNQFFHKFILFILECRAFEKNINKKQNFIISKKKN